MLNLNNLSYEELEQLSNFLKSINRNYESDKVLDYLAFELEKVTEHVNSSMEI